ncbi:MAG: energy-coupling factor ABC transporter substrate-binding protein [Actinomycetota bacterium]
MRNRALVMVILTALTVVTCTVAYLVGFSRGDFGGTDTAATTVITSENPHYRPWFSPLWSNPGGSVESGLFALQAALGAGVVGFVLGSFRERRRAQKETTELNAG